MTNKQKKAAQARREYERLEARRKELQNRKVLDESRRARFLVRLNIEIDAARRKMELLEMESE